MGWFATWRHIKRLKDVEERLDSLERAHESLDLEWTDVQEKIRRTLARITKRAEFVERKEAEQEAAEAKRENGDAGGLDLEAAAQQSDNPMARAAGLSGQQRAYQQAILRRRAGL